MLLHITVLFTYVITGVTYFLSKGFIFTSLSTRQALYNTEPYMDPFGISPSAFPLGDGFLLTIPYQICHSASSYFI